MNMQYCTAIYSTEQQQGSGSQSWANRWIKCLTGDTTGHMCTSTVVQQYSTVPTMSTLHSIVMCNKPIMLLNGMQATLSATENGQCWDLPS